MERVSIYVRPRHIVKATVIVYLTWSAMKGLDQSLAKRYGKAIKKKTSEWKEALKEQSQTS